MYTRIIPAAVILVIFGFFLPSLMLAQQIDGPALTLRAHLPHLPLIGDTAPEFEAESTSGPIRFPEDYQGKWVILFSHPEDFTPVCTSEFVSFGARAQEFEQLGAALIGLSTDSLDHHQKWKASIREKITFQGVSGLDIPFPIVADEDQEIAWRYGMLHPMASETTTVRALFIIDPAGKIRSLLFYPHTTGRDVDEIKRLLIGLQTSDRHQVSTPANWRPGDDVITPKPIGVDPEESKISCQTDYFCTRPLPLSESGGSLL